MKYALYSGTANLYDDMQMAAKSLVSNSDVDEVFFLIEDREFPDELPDIVTCIDVKRQRFFPRKSANIKTRFSYMSLMRAALALMPELKQIDRILSLDCDTVVWEDCSAIWDMPVDDCYFSAAREPVCCTKGLVYCNTGVALYNLEKLRDGKAEEIVHALNVQPFPNIEQDVFSYLCQGHIHDMPSEYNATRFTVRCSHPVIHHYAGVKAEKWRTYHEPTYYREMSWDEAMERHKEHVG